MTFRRSLFPSVIVILSSVVLVPACNSSQTPDQCAYFEWHEHIVIASTNGATVKGRCMQRAPDILEDGTPNCVVLIGHPKGPCECGTPGLQPVDDKFAGAVDVATDEAAPTDLACFCQMVALTGDAQEACQFDPVESPESGGEPVNGYCYVDQSKNIGDPEIAESCNDAEAHFIRFTGEPAKVLDGQQVFTFCAAKTCDDTEATP